MRTRLIFVVTIGMTLVSTWAAFAADSPDSPDYRVSKRIGVSGEGGWDYLTADSAGRRLFVTHATQVMVLDLDKGNMIGEIPKTDGVHGVAIAADLGRGFTSNGRAGTITIFDLKTLKPLAEVKSTGENPDAILYDSSSRRVFAFNGRTHNATAIDAKSGHVEGTISLEGKPEFAASDGVGRVFVNLEDKSTIAVIDARKLTVVNTWPLAPCEEPSGMAIDQTNKRLFVGCHNKMMAVVDAENGKIVSTVPIGSGVDANAYDPGTGLAFASCADGTLTVARAEGPDKYVAVQTVQTQKGARTMAVDEKTHTVYLATAQFGPAPQPTAENPHPRPSLVAGTFTVLVVTK